MAPMFVSKWLRGKLRGIVGEKISQHKMCRLRTFDLKFTYVLPGWEGTASDSRIIKNALTREDKLKIPNGKYYLVDAGFMNRSGLMAPFKGVRYHLKEYSTREPENTRELYNHRHASLRNAIE